MNQRAVSVRGGRCVFPRGLLTKAPLDLDRARGLQYRSVRTPSLRSEGEMLFAGGGRWPASDHRLYGDTEGWYLG
jgi:hypothetical protein